ncbi:hypothetical protein D9M71_316590 [compost metagenome]|jgi:hypothetical protein
MANTKRQQADAELLLTRAAFRITSDVSPDIPPPHRGDTTRGYLFFGVGSRPYVCEAWSTSTVHGTGDPDAAKRVCIQGAAHLYSTKAFALCALRRALEDESAKQLRAIDRLIEQETILK